MDAIESDRYGQEKDLSKNENEIELFYIKEHSIRTCPYCKSSNIIEKRQSSFLSIFSLILFFIPISVLRKKHHCFDCDKDWCYH